MDENKLKKQLMKITIITIISSIVISLAGIGLIAYLGNAAHKADHIQMQEETQEYKDRISKQLDKNFQILNSLSKTLEVTGVTNLKSELIEEVITEVNSENDFITLAYIKKDGSSITNIMGYGTENDIILDDLNIYAQIAIRQAFNGKNAVSKMYDSQYYNGKLFLYAVPVYDNNEIIGVIAANDTIEIFTDVANINSVMDGTGYIHIINSKGDFLVRSERSIIKEPYANIFEGPYLSDKTKVKTKEALLNNENVFGDFTYLDNKYHFYMESLDLNGWYLFCASKIWSYSLSMENIYSIIGAVLIIILILFNVLLYFGYKQIRGNIKNLLHLAYWDQVTGSENELKFDQNFIELQKSQKKYSTIALNIHNFKGVNDLFGKSHGDKVLCYIKCVVENSLKEGEFFCRSSADTFFIVFLDTDEKEISNRLNKIITGVKEASVMYGNYSYELSLYSGVAVMGDREKALVALQSIKLSHQKYIAFYNKALHDEIRIKNSIESNMHLALKNKEFKLFLQPKYNLKNDKLIGAEALVRWQNPDGSYRYPGEFIPLFESNGFCLKLDMYMLEKVCKQIRSWMDAGIKPIPISVNQSKLLFSDRNYPNNLEQITKKYNVPPSLITLEILEGVATSDMDFLNQQIEALHEKGFKVSMDDFGSGYSSLNMLYQLKIDELKLDRGFLRKVSQDNNERRQIILEQIIRFAKKLGIATVAEGIETQEDKNNMESLDCDYGQGYFYEKPINAEEFSIKYMS